MKKIILLLIAIIPMAINAQMKVSDSEKPELIGEYKLLGKLYARIEKTGDKCSFEYRDNKFTQTDNYKYFYFKYSDIDILYNLFSNFEGVEKGQEKTVDLDNGDRLYFKYEKTLGKMYAEVIHIDKAGVGGAVRWLNEKQLKKLFGKDK